MLEHATSSNEQPQPSSDADLATSTLEFVAPKAVDGYLAAARRLRGQGRKQFLFRAPDFHASLARACHDRIAAELPDVKCVLETVPADASVAPAVSLAGGAKSDTVFLFETSAMSLSAELMSFVDVPVSVVAPITEHFFRRRPLFMISVPKSGTHMLFELLAAFDFIYGGRARGPLSPQHFYFLLGENSHTRIRDFYRGAHEFQKGNADHPFFTTPALFMYRNPLDMVVSEAHYVANPRNTPLGHYYSTWPIDQRLLRLIGDDPVLGSLRERMAWYYPWLRLPNVIPICYEELVGPKGDGTLAAQLKTIWSLQLKLHVPGCPAYYAAAVFRRETNTFRNGKINSHREHLTDACYAALRKLDPDFMREFGYDLDDQFGPGYLPRFVDNFRQRPLVVSNALLESPHPENSSPGAPSGQSRAVSDDQIHTGNVYAYRGYFVAAIKNIYCALPHNAPRPVDPRLEMGGTALAAAATWDELKRQLDTAPLADDGPVPQAVSGLQLKDLFRLDPAQPVLAQADVCGYNIVNFNDRYYCVENTRGSLDVQWDDLTGVFSAPTLDEALAHCHSRAPQTSPRTPGASPTGNSGWGKLLTAAVSVLFRS